MQGTAPFLAVLELSPCTVSLLLIVASQSLTLAGTWVLI